jgi:protoheme ferro-lyase
LNFLNSLRRRWRAILAGAIVGIGSVVVVFFLMNQPKGWPFHWDAERVIAGQPADARATGRTGVIVVALMQPSHFETPFYINFVDKLLDIAIPWPISRIAGRDSGVALVDPDNPDRIARFRPKTLMAFDGRTHDWDGESYAAKFARGKVDWVAPSSSTAGDIGSFVYKGRSGGAAGPAQRAMLKARAIYYARLPGGYLPQRTQTIAMVDAAFARIRANKAVSGTVLFDVFNPADSRAAVFRLLDSGVDSLIIGSALPINSAFEEYRGAYPKLHKLVEEWAERRGKPAPRLLFTPQLADMPGYAPLWARHLAATAPPPPKAGASATLVVSLHGLPITQQQRDSWVENARRATAKLAPQLTGALKSRGWQNIHTVIAQEAFGDSVEDPANKLVSVSEVFAQARQRGDALAIAVPVEFLAENTDTLFLHSYLMFDGLPGYRRYTGPPADINWDKPYVRRFTSGATTHIYIGTPGAAAQAEAGAVLASAIETRLPK